MSAPPQATPLSVAGQVRNGQIQAVPCLTPAAPTVRLASGSARRGAEIGSDGEPAAAQPPEGCGPPAWRWPTGP